MKILVFTSLFPNNMQPLNGIFIKERMLRVSRMDGCHVQVVAPVPYYPPIRNTRRWPLSQVARHEEIDGMPVCHPRFFMTPKVAMSSYGVTMFLSVLPTLSRVRRHFDFDIIDAHYVYPDGMAAVLLGKVFRRPVTVSARGTDINLFSRFPLIRPLIRYTLRRADACIAVSPALQQRMLELGAGAQTLSMIPNGVDAEKFRRVPGHEARARLQIGEGPLFLSVGRLVELKGFEYLIRAVDCLRREKGFADVRLVIIGEGEERGRLERLVSELCLTDAVRFPGVVQPDDLHLWYSAADVFCLASSREGWPNVIMESLACGTPVVATPMCGLAGVLESEDLGLATERSSPAIAQRLTEALERSWDRERISAWARQQTWERSAASVGGSSNRS